MDANGVETAGEWKNGERIKAAILSLEPETIQASFLKRFLKSFLKGFLKGFLEGFLEGFLKGFP